MPLYLIIGIILAFVYIIFTVFAFVFKIGFNENRMLFEVDSFDPLVLDEQSFLSSVAFAILPGSLLVLFWPLCAFIVVLCGFAMLLKRYLENK